MNILVTAIGSFSAQCVVDSLKAIKSINKIIGCDIYPKQWHNVSKDLDIVMLSPLLSEKEKYKQFIEDSCKKHHIDLIIPLTDTEVDFFNLHRNYFKEKNIQITIGNPEFISIARDKKKLSEFIKQNSFDNITTYCLEDLDKAHFPIIGKPIDGRSSEGLIRLNSINEFNNRIDYSNYIFQEEIVGQICTVDYIRDCKSKDYIAIPRIELLRTKNGAGMTIEIINDLKILQITNKIGDLLNVHGCINFEFILNHNKYYLIDLNPRFSAGVGFSKVAGYDFPKNLYKLYSNETIDPSVTYKGMILQKKMIEVVNIVF